MPFDNSSTAGDRVYVPVPADRVDDVFRFLLGLTEPEGGRDADLDRTVRRVFHESEDSFRHLLELLASQPDVPMSTEEIAKRLNLWRGTASLAGMLGAFGRRSNNRYEGFSPFERLYNGGDEQWELVMPQKIAEIIRQIADE